MAVHNCGKTVIFKSLSLIVTTLFVFLHTTKGIKLGLFAGDLKKSSNPVVFRKYSHHAPVFINISPPKSAPAYQPPQLVHFNSPLKVPSLDIPHSPFRFPPPNQLPALNLNSLSSGLLGLPRDFFPLAPSNSPALARLSFPPTLPGIPNLKPLARSIPMIPPIVPKLPLLPPLLPLLLPPLLPKLPFLPPLPLLPPLLPPPILPPVLPKSILPKMSLRMPGSLSSSTLGSPFRKSIFDRKTIFDRETPLEKALNRPLKFPLLGKERSIFDKRESMIDKLLDLKRKGSLTTAEYLRFKRLLL